MKCKNAKQRAQIAYSYLLLDQFESKDERKYDDCFEEGDGDEVLRQLRILFKKNGVRYEHLTFCSQQHCNPQWFQEESPVDIVQGTLFDEVIE